MDINKLGKVSKLVRKIDEIDNNIKFCKKEKNRIWKIRAKSPICCENLIKKIESQIKDLEINKEKLKIDFIKL